MLKVGGRCASIVPDGVLFGSSTAHKALRKELIEKNRLEAIISMPSGVFKPYAGVSTAVGYIHQKQEHWRNRVRYGSMICSLMATAFDDKRTSLQTNDIPDIIKRFHSL